MSLPFLEDAHFAGQEPDTWRCDDCDVDIDGELMHCPTCGKSFEESALIQCMYYNPENFSPAECNDDHDMQDSIEGEGDIDLEQVDVRHLSSLCPKHVAKGGKFVMRNQETMGLLFGLMNDARAWQKIKSAAVITSLLYRAIKKTCKKPTDHRKLLTYENEERIPIPFNYFLEYDDKRRKTTRMRGMGKPAAMKEAIYKGYLQLCRVYKTGKNVGAAAFEPMTMSNLFKRVSFYETALLAYVKVMPIRDLFNYKPDRYHKFMDPIVANLEMERFGTDAPGLLTDFHDSALPTIEAYLEKAEKDRIAHSRAGRQRETPSTESSIIPKNSRGHLARECASKRKAFSDVDRDERSEDSHDELSREDDMDEQRNGSIDMEENENHSEDGKETSSDAESAHQEEETEEEDETEDEEDDGAKEDMNPDTEQYIPRPILVVEKPKRRKRKRKRSWRRAPSSGTSRRTSQSSHHLTQTKPKDNVRRSKTREDVVLSGEEGDESMSVPGDHVIGCMCGLCTHTEQPFLDDKYRLKAPPNAGGGSTMMYFENTSKDCIKTVVEVFEKENAPEDPKFKSRYRDENKQNGQLRSMYILPIHPEMMCVFRDTRSTPRPHGNLRQTELNKVLEGTENVRGRRHTGCTIHEYGINQTNNHDEESPELTYITAEDAKWEDYLPEDKVRLDVEKVVSMFLENEEENDVTAVDSEQEPLSIA
ncbi:MAG: hypothetical protein SGARI_001377, partial [Bacillariaceae sp.]